NATEAQRTLFEERFKTGLIKTYARGFFSYTDEKIKVYPYEPVEENARKAYIVQEIANKDGTTLLINYTMGRNKSNEWKLLNMVVNGINVGSTLNSQFQQAMEQTGDLDKVIDDWARPVDTPAALDVMASDEALSENDSSAEAGVQREKERSSDKLQ
ncbi:MAG: ABC transporter substrate-binding protein, partial [Pseudomonadales bacterium]|nr:ABC transporter substrate-binding protein [Pseudomonadales bacterium]